MAGFAFREGDEDKREGDRGEEQESAESEVDKARQSFFDALKELKENVNKNKTIAPPPPGEQQLGESESSDKVNEDEFDLSQFDPQPRPSERIYSSQSKNAGNFDEATGSDERSSLNAAENVGIIMKVLEGRIQRNIAMKGTHPGGLSG